jgi:hypothetical protein
MYNLRGFRLRLQVVFDILIKKERMRDICNSAYLKQVLKEMVFLYYDLLDKNRKVEFIFIKDKAKVYKKKAWLLKLKKRIKGFN